MDSNSGDFFISDDLFKKVSECNFNVSGLLVNSCQSMSNNTEMIPWCTLHESWLKPLSRRNRKRQTMQKLKKKWQSFAFFCYLIIFLQFFGNLTVQSFLSNTWSCRWVLVFRQSLIYYVIQKFINNGAVTDCWWFFTTIFGREFWYAAEH